MNISKYNLDLLIGVDEKNFVSINIVLFVEEFSVAMETDNSAGEKAADKVPNVNRSKDIYEALRNYLAGLAQVNMLI